MVPQHRLESFFDELKCNGMMIFMEFMWYVRHLSLRQLTLDSLKASSSKTDDAIDLKFSEYLGVAMYT